MGLTMLTKDATTLQLLVDLACSLTGADGAGIVLLGDPELRLFSGDEASVRRYHLGETGPTDAHGGTAASYFASSEVVGSLAVAPVTGPMGETGWIIAGSNDPQALDARDGVAMQQLSALVEDRLDRAAEQIRLDQLGEVLVRNQEHLQEARDRLAVSNTELEQFAYLAAHELLAPLRAVAVYAEVLDAVVLSDEPGSSDRALHCAAEIRAGISLMDQQVQYLLELSRTQVSAALTEPVDLRDVAAAALDTLQLELDQVGASVEVGDLPVVNAKFVPMQSVLANLVSNAVRYREPDRPLEIRIVSQPTDEGWKVSVFDNGVGLDASDRGRIFKLFERASTTAVGSGIGLALSRRIVNAFSGTMGMNPSEPHGSEFWIMMPRDISADS